MSNKKSIKILGGSLLVLAIVALLSITYATYTQTLSITGQASVEKQSWKVYFSSFGPVSPTGSATEVASPTFSPNTTTVTGINVKFVKPGDTIVYPFVVKNAGTFDAELSTLTIGELSCEGTGLTAETDGPKVCKNLKVEVLKEGTTYNTGESLTAGNDENLQLKISYNPSTTDPTELPENDVEVSNISVSLNYSQS